MIVKVEQILRPTSFGELWSSLRKVRGNHRFIAGGTDLVVKAKDGKIPTAAWIDLTALPELRGIRETSTDLVIGATATYTEIEESPLVRRWCPALVEGALEVGSPQIRNLGTLGGNIANASPAADGVPPLVAYGARVVIRRGDKRRVAPVHTIAVSPGRTTLAPGELITQILIRKKKTDGAFEKLGPRASMAIAKVSLAIVAVVRRGRLSDVRIALGAVGPTIIRAPRTERVLISRPFDTSLLSEAEQTIVTEASPITDFRSTADYRRAMCAVLLRRALRRVMDD